ncbi:MAG: peptidylprolyl isomerase [archaeon]
MESKEIPKKKTQDIKKERAENKKAQNSEKRSKIISISLFLILFLVVVVGALIIYLNTTPMTDSSPEILKKLSEINYKFFPKPEVLSAIVDEEKITASELDQRYGMLPPEYQPYISRLDLLDQIIDEKVLLKEAEKQGIKITESQVDEYVTELANESGVSVEEFATTLIRRGLTLAEAKQYYKRSMILNELLGSRVLNNAIVSEVDIEDYYNKNPELFIVPESANISHILICYNESLRCPSNFTKDEALEQAKKVRAMVKEDNFEELALEFSQEPAAKLTKGMLGWVNMEVPFDQNFLNETFKLETGELSQPIETVFGYHLIKVWEKKPEEVIELSVVYDQINQTMTSEMQSDLYFAYVSGLRNESNIIIYEK